MCALESRIYIQGTVLLPSHLSLPLYVLDVLNAYRCIHGYPSLDILIWLGQWPITGKVWFYALTPGDSVILMHRSRAIFITLSFLWSWFCATHAQTLWSLAGWKVVDHIWSGWNIRTISRPFTLRLPPSPRAKGGGNRRSPLPPSSLAAARASRKAAPQDGGAGFTSFAPSRQVGRWMARPPDPPPCRIWRRPEASVEWAAHGGGGGIEGGGWRR